LNILFFIIMLRTHGKGCTCHLDSEAATRHYHSLLQKLVSSPPSIRKRIFNKAHRCFIRYLGQCAKCTLEETIRLPDTQYCKLKAHERDLKFLADDKKKIKEKRERLIKKGGGFISVILPILTSAIAALVGNLISH